jgi:hypothetical protein
MTQPVERDWTCDRYGSPNSSLLFRKICKEVERIIRDDAHGLISGHADTTAQYIVSKLAHIYGMKPTPTRKTP